MVTAKEWADALRSGQYKQGEGRLRYNGTYCCLGVLCELAGVDPQNLAYPTLSLESKIDFFRPKDYGHYYDPEINPELLTEEEKLLPRDKLTFSALNDKGVSFDRIADLIEAEYGS